MSDLRPLTSRALTSLIDTLRPYLFEAKVLDLFAGQGRFGFAALEEGAAEAIFVEKDRKTSAQLSEELKKKKFSGKIENKDAVTWLRESTKVFEIIFADPPFPLWTQAFENELMREILPKLEPEGILVLKYPKKYLPGAILSGYISWKESLFGDSKLVYFKRQ